MVPFEFSHMVVESVWARFDRQLRAMASVDLYIVYTSNSFAAIETENKFLLNNYS